MPTSDIMAAFESGDVDLEDKTLMESTSFCRECMDQGHNILKCRHITSLTKIVKTRIKNFLD